MDEVVWRIGRHASALPAMRGGKVGAARSDAPGMRRAERLRNVVEKSGKGVGQHRACQILGALDALAHLLLPVVHHRVAQGGEPRYRGGCPAPVLILIRSQCHATLVL